MWRVSLRQHLPWPRSPSIRPTLYALEMISIVLIMAGGLLYLLRNDVAAWILRKTILQADGYARGAVFSMRHVFAFVAAVVAILGKGPVALLTDDDKTILKATRADASSLYDEALDALYAAAARSNRCAILWREPRLQHADDERGLLSALQDAAAPYRASVEDASAAAEAKRLGAAAAASRRSAETSSMAMLLHELADALERDAAFSALAYSAKPQDQMALAFVKGDVTDRYLELSRIEPDAGWSAAQRSIAAEVVRVAVARFAMLADDLHDRFRALSVWLAVDGEHGITTRSHFCGSGTDPELSIIARVLADDLVHLEPRRFASRHFPISALEEASTMASALARAADHLLRGPQHERSRRRFEANHRRITVLLAEDLGGLRTLTDEAQYHRAATLLAPIEVAIRADPNWEASVDVVTHAGGPALKLTSIVRVQLLLAVAYERSGRRDEAQALHQFGTARATPQQSGGNRGSTGGLRSLHHGGVTPLTGTMLPLRARAFWRREELSEEAQALVEALEAHWSVIAHEALEAMSLGAFLLTQENLAASARQWQSLDLRRRAEPVAEHCRLSPSTCSLLAQHAATLSPMGQAKFSALIGGSHIFPHAGPSNGRLRVHLGLYMPEHGYAISVDGVNATWAPGQALVLDDSLVHEVFAPPAARASSMRMILIVDIHHPDLQPSERERVRPFGPPRQRQVRA